ncbi:nucleotidyltransferase domain-containing protein [Candidatus Uhrbacteria bacterium]|nr:nucleotidyltransferase domain-containing protein [Candidatus Uhrbacteria bacterium]
MKIKFTENEKRLLKKEGVMAIYLFGSRAQGAAGPLSDFDFAVLLNLSGQKRGGRLYEKIYDILERQCPRTLKNDVIDIVFLRDVTLELRFHVIRYGKTLLDIDQRGRLNFEEKTMLEYCDFKPVLNFFDRAIIAAL